ncbi:hypothetical protein T265_01294 [Opisthorchis viverrini]|uniref:Uncharacterized protein n=1 Tax=Opisthorchis viverrini TaxID=6198 RepID=A0A074ZZV1_OPIVI|nr:hypothetical protein T265_01294 [Opisthorchis viverrini]KER32606.1 hypothetical protein T265_01294 [Opisthorchis viverrini]
MSYGFRKSGGRCFRIALTCNPTASPSDRRIERKYHKSHQTSARTTFCCKIVRDLSLPIRAHGACVNTKEELVAAWGDSLHNSADGRGLRELGSAFLNPLGLLLDWDFLRSQSVTCVCLPLWAPCVLMTLLCVAHVVEGTFLPFNLTPDPV